MRRIVLTFLLLLTFGVSLASAASRVGTELRVSVNDTPRQRQPVAALDGQGGALVVWANSRLGIIGRRIAVDDSATAANGAEMRLLANVNLPAIPGEGVVVAHKDPALLYEADGSFWVFWTRERAYLKSVPFHDTRTVLAQEIRARKFDAQGQGLGDSIFIGDGAPAFQSNPRAVRTSAGTIAVFWQSNDPKATTPPAGAGVYARFLAADGKPLGAAFRVNQGSNVETANPALATAADGRVLMVWDAPDGSAAGVYRRLYSAQGVALGDAQRVNTTTAGRQAHPTAAWLDGSGFLVLWHGATGERFRTRIYGQRLDGNGQPIGSQIEVSHGLEEYEYDPAVVATPGGTFMAAWMLWDKSFPRALRALELSGTGARLGSGEINVNTYRMDAQYRSFLATDTAGGVLAVWEGFFNKHAGISAQRIALSE